MVALGMEDARIELRKRYEWLIRLSEAIRSSAAQQSLFDLLAGELPHVVELDGIAHYDAPSDRLHWRFRTSIDETITRDLDKLPKEESFSWWVHHNGRILLVTSLAEESRFPAAVSVLKAAGVRSLCALPLTTAHRQLGSLVLFSRQEGAYKEDDIRFLSLAAAQIALAMADAMNYHESQTAESRLRLLLDLTNRLVSKHELRELLREVASSIRQVMNCEGVGISLPDAEAGGLKLYALDFPSGKGSLREGLVADETTTVMQVFRTGRPINLTPDQIRQDRIIAAEGANSVCRLPLLSHERILGVLSLGTQRENAFAAADIEFLTQVANQIAIAVENMLAYGQIASLKDKLAREKVYLEDEIRTELNFEEIVGKSDGLRHVLRQVETVAPTDTTVLIYGETGTGKELIARAVHNLSSRRSNAFVKLNCAAIPSGLLESELFGHEKGAFTGAIAQRIGRFELAHHGTVFLDEVGEIPLELQPKLLRVLQEREFERLGGTRTLHSDARLIAATNRDLHEMVEDQRFRADLYYRLNVFPVRVPPLRERPDDIPLLVRYFVQQFSRRNQRSIDTIPSDTMEALVQYSWPGNIRELQNVIERAVIVSKTSVLKVPTSDLKQAHSEKHVPKKAPAKPNLKDALDDEERKQILSALKEANWIVAGPKGAAALLGMKRSTLQFRMQKLGIRISRSGN